MGTGALAERSAELALRLGRLQALADEIAARRDELAKAIARQFLRTRRQAEGEVDLTLERLRAFEQVAGFLQRRGPVGTVAIVFPSNATLSNPAATLGTAFLCGNAVEARFPTSSGPWARLVEPLLARHLPGLRFDHGPGRAFLHRVLAAPEVPVTMIFGDDTWVHHYESLVRDHRKKLIFEGPGKDPFLVLAGADVERAAQDAVRGAYYNAGQACTSPERFYVVEELAAAFTDRVVELTRRQIVGDPRRDDVTVGPIANQRVVERIRGQLSDAEASGARILVGGRIRDGQISGQAVSWVEPTVLTHVTPSMALLREETLGPIIPIQVVADAQEALHWANDSPYGLAACLYGGTEAVAEALAQTHGQVFRNEIWLDHGRRELHAPYGGRKRSGWVWEIEDGRLTTRDGARRNVLEFSRLLDERL